MLAVALNGFTQEWTESLALEDLTPNGGEYFGESVTIDGDYAVIGSTVDGDIGDGNDIPGIGTATIYKKSGDGSWGFLQKITSADTEAG